jgi:hypothetical protein
MKRRYRYLLNFLSCGLLLFALYLNFVKKESVDVSESPVQRTASAQAPKQAVKTSAVFHAAQTFSLR